MTASAAAAQRLTTGGIVLLPTFSNPSIFQSPISNRVSILIFSIHPKCSHWAESCSTPPMLVLDTYTERSAMTKRNGWCCQKLSRVRLVSQKPDPNTPATCVAHQTPLEESLQGKQFWGSPTQGKIEVVAVSGGHFNLSAPRICLSCTSLVLAPKKMKYKMNSAPFFPNNSKLGN